jgi:hypothetical protein
VSAFEQLLAPWIHATAIIWCGAGLWFLLQPAALSDKLGGLVLDRWSGRKFGASLSTMDRVVAAAKQREELVTYDVRIGRIGGAACLIIGVTGLLTSLDPVIVSAAACVTIAWTTALYLTSATRADGKYVASLGVRYPTQLVSWWLFVALAVQAGAEVYVDTPGSIVAGVSTAGCAIAIWWAARGPGVVFGYDAAIEEHIDARFRLSRLGLLIFIPIGLSEIWLATSYAAISDHALSHFIARLIVQLGVLVPYIFLFAAIWKCNRDLRRVVTGT